MESLGDLFECRVHGDVRVGDEEHRPARAVVGFDDPGEGRGLACARGTPHESRVASKGAPDSGKLLFVEYSISVFYSGRRLDVSGPRARLTDDPLSSFRVELRFARAHLLQTLLEAFHEEGVVGNQSGERDLRSEIGFERDDKSSVAEGDEYAGGLPVAVDDSHGCVVAEIQVLENGEAVEPVFLGLPDALAAAQVDLAAASSLPNRRDFQSERVDHA